MVVNTAPTAPVLTVTAARFTAALSWTAATEDGSPITRYEIHRSVDGGSYSLYDNVGASVLGYTYRSGERDASVGFKVRAINTVGSGDFSNSVAVR